MDAARRAARALAAIIVVGGLTVATPAAAETTAVADRQNAGHTGFAGGGSLDRPPLKTAWSRDLGTNVGYPVAAGGRVYVVTTDPAHQSATLHALDATTGTTRWFRPIGVGAQLTLDGGRLFAVDNAGVVTAVDAVTGATLWLRDMPTNARKTSPVAGNGLVFVYLGDWDGILYALEAGTGTTRWTSAEVRRDDGGPALDGTSVYVNEGCRSAALLRETGRRRWVHTETGCANASARIAVDGGRVFTPPYIQDAATGDLRDQHFGGPPSVVGSTLVALNGATLQARNVRTGVARWEFAGDGGLVGAPLVVNHTVYIGSTTGMLYAVDLRTGEQTWSASQGTGTACAAGATGCVTAAPGLTGSATAEGRLLVPFGGKLIALEDEAVLPAPGLDLEITTGPDAPTSSSSAAFTFTATGTGFTYRCRLDDGDWAPCTGTASFTGLSEGAHTFEVETVDGAGTPIALASRGFSVYLSKAKTTLTATPKRYVRDYYSESNTFRFKTEHAAVTECRVDGGAWVQCTNGSYSASYLNQGDHVFEVRSVDVLGVVEDPALRHQWTYDSSPPTVTFTQKPASSSGDTSVTFAFEANEPGVTFQCRLDSEAYAACTSPVTRTSTAGYHSFSVKGTDPAGNTAYDATSTSWTTVPDTVIDTGPPATTTAPRGTFTFRSTIPGSVSFECRVDQHYYWSSCSSPYTTSSLSAGTHTFEVRAGTSSGYDATPATHTWTITVPDTVAPQTTIDEATAPSHGSARFAFSSSEAGSTFVCSLDGGAYAGCTSPAVWTGLSAGAHQLQVAATDAAGNKDASPAIATVMVTAAPVEQQQQQEPPAQQEQQQQPVDSSTTAGRSAPAPAEAPAAPAAVNEEPSLDEQPAAPRAALPGTPRAFADSLLSLLSGISGRELAKTGTVLAGYSAPAAGVLDLRLTAKSGRRTIVVGTAHRRFAAGESRFVSVKLTKAGRKLLKAKRSVRIAVQVSFARGRATGATVTQR